MAVGSRTWPRSRPKKFSTPMRRGWGRRSMTSVGFEEGFGVIFDRLAEQVLGEEGFLIRCEFAEILLAVPAVAHGHAVSGEVGGPDARTLGRRNFDALPTGAALHPGAIEKTAPPKGSGDEPNVAAADSEDGEHGEVEVILDARGFIDKKQAHAGVAAIGGFGTGEADDAGAIRQHE